MFVTMTILIRDTSARELLLSMSAVLVSGILWLHFSKKMEVLGIMQLASRRRKGQSIYKKTQ